jgi:hypothetical protein
MPSHADLGIGAVVSHPDFAAQWIHTALRESLLTNVHLFHLFCASPDSHAWDPT